LAIPLSSEGKAHTLVSLSTPVLLRETRVPVPHNYLGYLYRLIDFDSDSLDFARGVISPVFQIKTSASEYTYPLSFKTKLALPYFLDMDNDICLA